MKRGRTQTLPSGNLQSGRQDRHAHSGIIMENIKRQTEVTPSCYQQAAIIFLSKDTLMSAGQEKETRHLGRTGPSTQGPQDTLSPNSG